MATGLTAGVLPCRGLPSRGLLPPCSKTCSGDMARIGRRQITGDSGLPSRACPGVRESPVGVRCSIWRVRETRRTLPIASGTPGTSPTRRRRRGAPSRRKRTGGLRALRRAGRRSSSRGVRAPPLHCAPGGRVSSLRTTADHADSFATQTHKRCAGHTPCTQPSPRRCGTNKKRLRRVRARCPLTRCTSGCCWPTARPLQTARRRPLSTSTAARASAPTLFRSWPSTTSSRPSQSSEFRACRRRRYARRRKRPLTAQTCRLPPPARRPRPGGCPATAHTSRTPTPPARAR
mmetsp:Transcript_28135/g.64677  ORF Transcript_28135/g.64677 Transcript_28135/m.64677 type:complete len:290 (-) Transcript_28135:554-1423(-)